MLVDLLIFQQRYIEQNIGILRDSDNFRKELEEQPKLALFILDSMSEMSGANNVKRRRISSSPLTEFHTAELGQIDSTSTRTENDHETPGGNVVI